jgi:thiamine-phosphate diphosphorylase
MYPNWFEATRLWLVTDLDAAGSRSLAGIVGQSCAGGVDAVLCRLKELPMQEQKPIARELRQLCEKLQVPFVVSHEVQLAAELGADGVQLGIGDMPLAQARHLLPQGCLVGYSTHSVEEARRMLVEGADYVFIGPLFPTPKKLKYGDPLGVETVAQVDGQVCNKAVFIGGINEGNAVAVAQRGGRRIAVIGALHSAVDPKEAARRLKSRFTGSFSVAD